MHCVSFYKTAFKRSSLYEALIELIKAKIQLKIKETAHHFSKTSCDEGLLYKACGNTKKKTLEHILELISFSIEITHEVSVFNRTIFKVFLKEVNLRFVSRRLIGRRHQ